MNVNTALYTAILIVTGSAQAATVTLQLPEKFRGTTPDGEPWTTYWYIDQGTNQFVKTDYITGPATIELSPGYHEVNGHSNYELAFAAIIKVEDRADTQCFTVQQIDGMGGEGSLPSSPQGITNAGACINGTMSTAQSGQRTIRRNNSSQERLSGSLDRFAEKDLDLTQIMAALQVLPLLQKLVTDTGSGTITHAKAAPLIETIRMVDPKISSTEIDEMVNELNILRNAYHDPSHPDHQQAVATIGFLSGFAQMFQGQAGGSANPFAALMGQGGHNEDSAALFAGMAAMFGGAAANDDVDLSAVLEQMGGSGENDDTAALMGMLAGMAGLQANNNNTDLSAVLGQMSEENSDTAAIMGLLTGIAGNTQSENDFAAVLQQFAGGQTGQASGTDTPIDANGSNWCTTKPYCTLIFDGEAYHYPLGWKVYPLYYNATATQEAAGEHADIPTIEAERRSDGARAWVNVRQMMLDDCVENVPLGDVCFDTPGRPISTEERQIFSGYTR